MINVNNHLTPSFESKCGVRQGDPLSSTLFNIFINDFPMCIAHANCGIYINKKQICSLMFADDIVLLSDSQIGLQKQLDLAHTWAANNQVKFNESKSFIVHYRPTRAIACDRPFRLGQMLLKFKNNYKYLGITLDEHLNYNVTADILSQSATRALGAIIYKHKQINFDYNKYFYQII